MSTDRKLLELAAKAAGLKGRYVDCSPPYITFAEGEPGSYRKVYWNPLLDDGDALRLAAKLRIDLEFDSVRVFAFIPSDGGVRHRASEFYREHQDSEAAATRRAITRAAAEIGRAMP